jgi:uncharacterized protein (TIGR02271 family)
MGAKAQKDAVMSEEPYRVVRGRDGWQGLIESTPSLWDSPQSEVGVRLYTGQELRIPANALIRQPDGSYYVDLAWMDLENAYASGDGDPVAVIPVIQEELDIQKHLVERGRIRLTKTVHEHEELVDEPLMHEEITVERVPVNLPVDTPPSVRYEGDTMIVPVVEEVLVVEKRLLVKEELRIAKRQVEDRHSERVVLRSEEVSVARVESPALTSDKT